MLTTPIEYIRRTELDAEPERPRGYNRALYKTDQASWTRADNPQHIHFLVNVLQTYSPLSKVWVQFFPPTPHVCIQTLDLVL
jgi:hypothetical protein